MRQSLSLDEAEGLSAHGPITARPDGAGCEPEPAGAGSRSAFRRL
jgi:hypothetical protein